MNYISWFLLLLSITLWGSAFAYLSFETHDPLQWTCLITIGLVSIIGIGYWWHTTRKHHTLQQKIRLLQTGATSFTPAIEAVLFDDKGKAIWTTHPNTYPNQEELIRKLLLRAAPSPEAGAIKKMLDERKPGEHLLSGGGNGLGQDQKWWLVMGTPIDTPSVFGRHAYLITIRDLTTYLENHQLLKNSCASLENFIDQAPFGLFYASRQGKIIGANSTFCQWLGLTKDELLGRSVQDYVDDTQKNRGLITIRNSNTVPFKAVILNSSKNTQNFRSQAIILCRVDSLEMGMKYDLLHEQTYADAQIPAAMICEDGSISSRNTSYTVMMGDMSLSQNFYEIIHPGGRSEVMTKIRRLFDSPSSQKSTMPPFEIRFNDDKVHTTAYASRLTRPDTGNAEVMLQLIDISEQKRLERQFIQSQKMQAVGQLAGGIAHDFNNLLTAMIGFCDLLLQRYLPNDPSYNDVMQIKQNGSRAANLVRQLLAFSRQQTLQPKIVNVTDSLVELSNLLRRLIGAGIELEMIHGRDLWLVKVDVSQLEQVIINLVVNARDAMADGGKITLRTANLPVPKQYRIGHDLIPKGDYLTIEVIDTGHGIPAEYLDTIFEPFFSTKEVGQGTGLGLSTVYGIVKQTGGFVLVDSTPNQGTTFRILLPRYKGPEQTATPTPTESFSGDLTGAGTILLVEDEDAVRMFSARALREKGYRVLEAASGEAALELLNNGEKFDLLVTDVVMPKMDGPTLSKKVRDLFPDTKIIFISGYTEDTFRKNLDFDAKIHFLPKPFTLKDLASKVKEVLTVKAGKTKVTEQRGSTNG